LQISEHSERLKSLVHRQGTGVPVSPTKNLKLSEWRDCRT